MKSELFRDNPTPSHELAKDLLMIAGLQNLEAMSGSLASAISRYLQAPTSKEESEALQGLREQFHLSSEHFEALFKVCTFLMREMGDDDSAEGICDDLNTLGLASGKMLGGLAPFVRALVEEHKRSFGAIRKVYATQHAILKVPTAVTSVVDLRVVIHKGFKPGDDPNRYEPSIATLVPVAIMRLRFDDDDTVVFQMDYRTLRLIVATLVSAEKEMDEARRFVGEAKVHLGRQEEP